MKRSCPQWKLSQLIFLIHYAIFLHCQLARGPRHKITRIAYTFDSKSTWWIGCLPGSSQTCLLPPLAYQMKPPFFSLLSLAFISLSHFHSHRLQSSWQEQIVTLCDMAVGQNYAAPPSPCQYPNSRVSVRGLWEGPAGWLVSTSAGGTPASLPTFTSV